MTSPDDRSAPQIIASKFSPWTPTADPANWCEVPLAKAIVGCAYDYVDMDTGKVGQCWLRTRAEWVQPPTGNFRLLTYGGPDAR